MRGMGAESSLRKLKSYICAGFINCVDECNKVVQLEGDKESLMLNKVNYFWSNFI